MASLKALGEKAGLVFGKPSAAQDQNAFAVTAAFATKYGVKTLSELAAEVLGCGDRARRPAGVPAAAEVPGGSGLDVRLPGRFVQLAGRRWPADQERA